MSSGLVALEMFVDGAWQDLVLLDDVLTAQPIVIKRGQSDEAIQLRPSSLTARLANDDDRYRTSNPTGPLYGKAGRNTPVRVSVDGVVRGATELSSLTGGESRDFRAFPRRGSKWADLQTGGLLRRIAQWTEPLRSPFYTYNTTELTALVGYWPMEDPRGTTTAFSPVAGATNPLLRGVSFDSQQRPPGSAPLADVVLQDASRFQFVTGGLNDTTGWQYSMVVNMASLRSSFFTPVNIECLNGLSVFFSIDDSTDATNLLVADNEGNTLISDTLGLPFAGYAWSGRWIMFTVQASYSGGTTTVDAYYRAIDEDDAWHSSGSFSGVPSSLYLASCSGLPENSTFGHVIGVADVGLQLTNGDRFTALKGHAGETVAERFERLCTLKGIDFTVLGTGADSSLLGPQAVDTFAKQLEELIATEDALIFDAIDEVGLVLLLRNARYNQTPALTLRPTDLAVVPPEVTDDLNINNIVTASQRNGGDYTVRDDTTPLVSTQPPPDGAGEYRQTVDVNVADEAAALPQEANWWLRRGTVDLPRFPALTLNLGPLDADMVADIEAVEIGSVIEILDLREDTVRLFVLGWTETLRPADQGKVRRTIVFTCAADRQFQVGVLDTNRLQAKYTTLSTGLGRTDTTVVLQSSQDREQWRAGASTAHIMVAGERIALGTVGARAGSGPWTFTVTGCTRSVNGVVKTQAAGEPVKVVEPIRLAL